MNRDEIIEFVRLSIEDFEETFDEIEGAAYSFLDGAALMAKDNLQMLTESPQEAAGLLQMLETDNCQDSGSLRL